MSLNDLGPLVHLGPRMSWMSWCHFWAPGMVDFFWDLHGFLILTYGKMMGTRFQIQIFRIIIERCIMLIMLYLRVKLVPKSTPNQGLMGL